MEMNSMFTLYSTFFIWFLSWTLLESIMTYYKLTIETKIKIIIILLIIAVWNYSRIKDTNTSNDCSCD
jgi:hypothetical protein